MKTKNKKTLFMGKVIPVIEQTELNEAITRNHLAARTEEDEFMAMSMEQSGEDEGPLILEA